MKRDRGQRDEQAVEELEAVVERARSGDREALELVVTAIQDRVFALSLRMLGDRSDAEDAAQEILVKVVTRLDSFRGKSKFTTWVYAVAANHLRNLRARGLERDKLSFDLMANHVASGRPGGQGPLAPEHRTHVKELRLLCLHQLLVCLDRDHRLAFVLGESLELTSREGAQVLGIQPAAFRKRLSRARRKMQEFMYTHCGLVRASNPCRCEMWVEPALRQGVIVPAQPRFAEPPDTAPGVEQLSTLDAAALEGLDELSRIATLFRNMPSPRTPAGLLDRLTQVIAAPPDSQLKA